ALPKASRLSRAILRGLAALYARFFARPAATVGDAYAALNHGLHHLIQYLYTLREERLLSLLTARADEPHLLINSREIVDELDDPDRARALAPATQRRLLFLSQLFYASLIERRARKTRWIGQMAFAVVGSCLLVQAIRAAVHYHPGYVARMSQG